MGGTGRGGWEKTPDGGPSWLERGEKKENLGKLGKRKEAYGTGKHKLITEGETKREKEREVCR